MAKILLIVALLANNPSHACDSSHDWFTPSKLQLGALFLAGLATCALADTNSTNTENASSTTGVLCTPYFVYWSTWLGVTYGIVDVSGWILDWIIGTCFYLRGDSKKVKKLKKRVQQLEQQKQHSQREEVLTIAKLCRFAREEILHEDNVDRRARLLLECVGHAKNILREQIDAEEQDKIIDI